MNTMELNSLEKVWELLKNQELKPLQEVMTYCEQRVTADEGIPAVIGLDDLTSSWNTTYTGAVEEEGFQFLMAAGALIFASLYEQEDPEKLGNYPGIAPAMSAMAELFFRQGKEGEAIPYRDVVKDFIK